MGIVARISGCSKQKEVSLDDQEDHGKEVVAELYEGPADCRVIATKGKGDPPCDGVSSIACCSDAMFVAASGNAPTEAIHLCRRPRSKELDEMRHIYRGHLGVSGPDVW